MRKISKQKKAHYKKMFKNNEKFSNPLDSKVCSNLMQAKALAQLAARCDNVVDCMTVFGRAIQGVSEAARLIKLKSVKQR